MKNSTAAKTASKRIHALRRSTALTTVALALIAAPPASAQTWGGPGSTTTTPNYNLNTNWGPATVPDAAGEAATFTATGSGTVTVGAAIAPDSWTFDATTHDYDISGSTVTFGGAGVINNGGSGTDISIANIVAGAGASVVQNGAGTLTLSGANTYTGGTTLNAGTLAVGHNSALGTGVLTVNGTTTLVSPGNPANVQLANNVVLNGAQLTVRLGESAPASLGLAGAISGTGSLNITRFPGNTFGFLRLTNANTYSGGTTLNDVGVTISNGAALGTGAITVNEAHPETRNLITIQNVASQTLANNITLNAGSELAVLGQDASHTLSGNISGTGALVTNSPANTLTLSGVNTYSGATTVIGGTLRTGSATAFSAASAHKVEAAATLDLGGFNQTIGSLSGVAGATVTNGGGAAATLTAGGDNSSTAYAGVLQDGASPLALTKTGTGTLTLSGANSYAGTTTVADGTLRLSGGSALLDAGAVIVNDGTLDVTASETIGSLAGAGGAVALAGNTLIAGGNNSSTTFAGAFTGTNASAVTKAGTGTMTLTGNSGAFAGATTVEAGTLAVNGTLGGTLDILAGARLEGAGTVGTTTVAAGGAISPGNSIGTLAVNGDIAFAAGSTYEVEIDPALEGDLIEASGAATIDGGTVHVLKAAGVYMPGSRWTILGAGGGVTGTFDDLTQTMPFVDLALAYDANAVYLDVERNAVSFCDVARTFNQCSTGHGVESAGAANPVYDAVAALPDDESARAAFDALSGEAHASVKAALLDDSRHVREAASQRVRAAFESVAAPSLPVMAYGESGPQQAEANTDRFAVWGQALGAAGSIDGDGNAAEFDRTTGGFLAGADALFGTWRLGLLAGYSHTSFDVDARASSGSSDNFHVGLYGGSQWGRLAVRAGAAYTWHDIQTARQVVFPGFGETLSADYDAGTAQVFGEFGYRIDADRAAFEPFASLAYVKLRSDAFAEAGGAAALTSAKTTTDATFTTLGIRASTDFGIGDATATARGMLGWRHAFGDVAQLSTFAFAGGAAFTIAGAPIADDALAMEAGLDFDVSANATLGISYSGQIASNAQDHAFKADLSVKF